MVGENYIVTTRPTSKFGAVGKKFCFSVLNMPLTEVETRDLAQIKDEILEFGPDVIVITSEVASKRLLETDLLDNAEYLICIGDKSAEPLKKAGLSVIVPDKKNSKGIVDTIASMDLESMKIALCRSSVHNMIIDNYLNEHNYNFKSIDIYNIRAVESGSIIAKIEDTRCVGVLVTSSMEATLLVELARKDEKTELLTTKIVFSIGEPTSDRLRELGIKTEALKAQSSVDEILREIAEKHCYSGEWI